MNKYCVKVNKHNIHFYEIVDKDKVIEYLNDDILLSCETDFEEQGRKLREYLQKEKIRIAFNKFKNELEVEDE